MILWTNATFYTMEEENKYVNQVLTDDGKIIAIGDNCQNFKPAKIIDLKGSFVFPGFVDAHIHLIGYGRKLASNHLNFEKDKKKALIKIKNFYHNNHLRIEGYFNNGITKEDLDKISENHYVILRHNDYHSFTVNSKVLATLNIKSNDGILTNDQISKKVNVLWENNNKATLTNFTIKAIEQLKSLGITSVHTDDLSYFNSYDETLEILNKLSLKHKFRINTLIHNEVMKDYLNKVYPNNKYLNPIQFKYFYDGTISSKTALLSDNYFGTNFKGNIYLDEKIFLEDLKKIREMGKGVAIHVIGDQGLENVLNLLRVYPQTKEFDRIVHASLAKPNIKINIPIDIQPSFKIEDEQLINNNIKFEVLKYPFKLYNNQTIINSSSDAPVSNPNPLLKLSYLKEISRFDAIRSYTTNPNLTINVKSGLIKEGYLADFTCFDKDILMIKNAELLKTKVKYTIINEEINSY